VKQVWVVVVTLSTRIVSWAGVGRSETSPCSWKYRVAEMALENITGERLSEVKVLISSSQAAERPLKLATSWLCGHAEEPEPLRLVRARSASISLGQEWEKFDRVTVTLATVPVRPLT
jgi:hypothetical protein